MSKNPEGNKYEMCDLPPRVIAQPAASMREWHDARVEIVQASVGVLQDPCVDLEMHRQQVRVLDGDCERKDSNVEFKTRALAAAMPKPRKGRDAGAASWVQGHVGECSDARGSIVKLRGTRVDPKMHNHRGRYLDSNYERKVSNQPEGRTQW